MGLRIIYGKAGSGKSEYCFNQIAEDVESHKIYIITPEQFSFTAEKKLMEAINADSVFNSEVITFNRMAYRVMQEIGFANKTSLTKCGKAMLIYEVLNRNKQNLKFLGKSNENIETVRRGITEFKKHGITVNMLKNEINTQKDRYLKSKLEDMGLIYEEFENAIIQKYIDENDTLTVLGEYIDTVDLFNDSVIYIDEFAGFTKQEYDIITKLLKITKQVNITICADDLEENTSPEKDVFYPNKKTANKLYRIAKENNIKINEPVNCDKIYRFQNKELQHLEKNIFAVPYKKYEEEVKNIELFLANNQYSEIENIAKNILCLVKNKGYRYNNISVITKNIDTYSGLIKAIFKQYNIPVFIDEKKDLSQNIIVKYIISILEIFARNWSYESVFNYLKIGFTDIEDEEIYKLENYCIKWGITGSKWYKNDWKYGLAEDEKQVLRYNELRKIIIEPLIKFKEIISKNKTAKEITSKLYEFLIQMDIEEKINQKIEKLENLGLIELANEYQTGLKNIIDVFDEIVLIFQDEKMSFEKYTELLKIGLKNSGIGKIPATQDQVIIGDIDRSRSHKVKSIFLIGLNDGIFPSINKDEGFFNDSDREKLKENNLELAKSTIEQIYDDNYNTYKAFTTAEENIYLSYSSLDSEGNSLRPSIYISKIKKIFPNIKEKSDELENINRTQKQFSNIAENLDKIYIDKLYGNCLHTTVSRLEEYKKCPFSFYLKYGLHLNERETFTIKALDTGSFMHEVIDEFFENIKSNNIDVKTISDEKLDLIVRRIIQEKLSLDKNYILQGTKKFKLLTQKLIKVVSLSVKYIVEGLKNTDFRIIGNEVEFKKGKEYPPITIELDGGKRVEITGKIDRIDLGQIVDKKYIRIIDYKSSVKSIDLNEVISGIQLQLLTYLDATCENNNVDPAGILYFNLIEPVIKKDKPLNKEELEAEIKKKFKMNGLILADINVINLMDKNLSQGYSDSIPVYVGKEGDVLPSKSNVITKEQFTSLQKYVKKIVKEIAKQIYDGNIGAAPFYNAKTQMSACQYCEFKAVCQFDTKLCGNKYNYISNLKKEIILDMIKQAE